MNRKSFIKDCGFACLQGMAAGLLLQGCRSSAIINGEIRDDNMIIPLDEFVIKNKKEEFQTHLIVHHEMLQFPICIFRISATVFSALWMQCSHQGSELQVFGHKLQCPAHGSEFDNLGRVQNGPADAGLRTFPVLLEHDHLTLSLKAV